MLKQSVLQGERQVSNELTGSPSAPLALCQWSDAVFVKPAFRRHEAGGT